MKDYQLDGNKEMVALGTMNVVGSMTSCYVTTGAKTWKYSFQGYLFVQTSIFKHFQLVLDKFVSHLHVGSFSRSAVNFMAGCNTTVSNIVMSLVVLLTLELITPLFKYTPIAILASIIITAVIGLIDIEAVILIWKIDKFDFIACMGAFFGVVFSSVEKGLLIAVSKYGTFLHLMF